MAQRSAPLPFKIWPGAWGVYKFSKAAVLKNLQPMLVLSALSLLLSLILNSYKNDKTPEPYAWIVILVCSLVSLWLQLGLFKLALAGARDKLLSLNDAMKTATSLYINGFFLTILVSVLLILSILALIIPFFFVAPRLILSFYYLVDKELSPVESIKHSWHDSKGHSIQVYEVVLVTVMFALLTLVLIGIYFSFIYQAAFALLYLFVTKKAVGGNKLKPAG